MQWTQQSNISPGTHVLTFAEVGFSCLSCHAGAAGISPDEQGRFANAVDRRNEVGTLLPRAAISAMPRGVIRDTDDPARVLHFLREMRAAVIDGRVPQRRVEIHLATPMTPAHARAALEAFEAETEADEPLGISWVVVLGEGEVPPNVDAGR